MREFPSCFSESGIEVADFSSSGVTRAPQDLVTCVYQCELQGMPCFITVTWTKNLMGQALGVEIEDLSNNCLCKFDVKPWFSKRKGYRNLKVDCGMLDIHWDLSSARFGPGPEPLEGFYFAVVSNQQIVLLLGDLEEKAYKKLDKTSVASSTIFIARREHIFGKKYYSTRAQFFHRGQLHDILIECDTVGTNDPCLAIQIDGRVVMQVKRLQWKFRGNNMILVDELPVVVYWDIHNWLFGNVAGNGIFLFRTCLSAGKSHPQSSSDASALNWSSSERLSGFSLVLCAWKNE